MSQLITSGCKTCHEIKKVCCASPAVSVEPQYYTYGPFCGDCCPAKFDHVVDKLTLEGILKHHEGDYQSTESVDVGEFSIEQEFAWYDGKRVRVTIEVIPDETEEKCAKFED